MTDLFQVSPLKVGCGKFYHGKGLIALLPGEIKRLGGKALIIGGPSSIDLVMKAAEADLNSANVTFQVIRHRAQCTTKWAEDYAKMALEGGYTVLVGCGGGKVIDEVKGASYFSDLPIITVPTSLATCVATSMVAIMYNDKGQRAPAITLKKEVDICIADEDLIGSAPQRLMAAGILDDIAKMPESYHKKMNVRDYRDCSLEEFIQILNSRGIYDFLLGEGRDLYDKGRNARRFHDAILTNLLHTSIVSGFADGSGQLAIAHATYDFMRNYNTEKAAAFLHGEIVAVGLMIQMTFNGYPESEIQKVRDLMAYMHMPLTLEDIQFEISPHGLDFFVSKVAEATSLSGTDVELLRKSVKAAL